MSTSISVGPRARRAAAGLALAALAVGCATPPPPVRAGQSPGYAASAWATLHRDSRNSDFAPLFATPALRVAWAALEGAAMWVGPSLGPEGHVYATSGRGEGTSHLHAFDRDGNLLWESAPMRSLADLDYGAVINAPLVADDGDVYQADVDQLWAFDANGAVRWVASLRDAGAQGHFVTPIFSKEGHVGGITTDGKVLFFARADGALVWPAFDLPGVGGPPATSAPPGLLEGGLHAREFVQPMWNLIFGREIEVANTPSVHPETGRIFITAGGASPSEGALYGIDTTPEGPVVAFAHPMAQGSGTSPAISPDGALVYAAGDDGVMVAVDAATGALVWRAEDTAAAASPSIGGDGVVYSTTRGQGLVAIDGRTGARRFAVDFTPLAERVLAESPERGPRVASVNSILTVTDGAVWAVLDLGYRIGGEAPAGGAAAPGAADPAADAAAHAHGDGGAGGGAAAVRGMPQPHRFVVVAVSPSDGAILGATEIAGSSSAFVVPDVDGRVYVSLAAVSTSMSFYGVNPALPEALRAPGPPVAGLVALAPVSPAAYARDAVDALRAKLARAAAGEAGARVWSDAVDAARAQLAGLDRALADAAVAGELDAPTLALAAREAGAARRALDGALGAVAGRASDDARARARREVAAARASLIALAAALASP